MVAISFLASLLLASAALAAPSKLEARVQRRREGRQSQPNNRIPGNPLSPESSNSSHVTYFTNWAGAAYSHPTGTFTSVTGTFVVPTPKAASGNSSTYYASAWVGIDGYTCDSAILQTGVDFSISGGKVSYDAWYEWIPDQTYDFSDFSIHAGDTITVTVTASSTKAGKAVITNASTGQTVSKSLTSSSALCEQNAEWIVEDYSDGVSLLPFANFGTVSFTSASATTASGSTIGPSGATIIDIRQNGTVLTSVTTSSSGVVIKYI